MIVFPTDLQQAQGQPGTIRAGGTDLMERQGHEHSGPIVDLRDVRAARAIAPTGDGGTRIGALVTIAEIAKHPQIRAGYPALAAAAGTLATPQIRAVGTLGGNLLQHTRCWYYRAPEAKCLKKGGNSCYARAGDHLWHGCFDLGPCVSVHPSTLAMALLAYDAGVEVLGAPIKTVAELMGDGADPTRDNALPPGAVVGEVVLPPPVAAEQSAYMRAISRAQSEWPLVEVAARLGIVDGTIAWAKVAVGGVAPVPLRLPAVEGALVGAAASVDTFAKVAGKATEGAKPLPMTGYKLELLTGAVADALEQALAAPAVTLAAIRAAAAPGKATPSTPAAKSSPAEPKKGP